MPWFSSFTLFITKKGESKSPPPSSETSFLLLLHDVRNLNSSVIYVVVSSDCTTSDCSTTSKWVCSKTITCLETNFWLECVLTNCTNHLKWNVWAVEDTSIVW